MKDEDLKPGLTILQKGTLVPTHPFEIKFVDREIAKVYGVTRYHDGVVLGWCLSFPEILERYEEALSGT